MPRCKKKPSTHDGKCKTNCNQTYVRNDNEALKQEHLRAHTFPYTANPHPCTSDFKELIAGPSGLAATRRHTLCHYPTHVHPISYSSSGSSGRESVGHDLDSSSSASDYCPYIPHNSPTSMFYWLARVLGRFLDFTVDLGSTLSSLWYSLPLAALLLKGVRNHLRGKALTVAGLTLLGLGCWFFIPTLFQQPSSGSMNTASGINLAKIQEQLMDIQKQLGEKEAQWKETLLIELGSLQSEEKITSGLKVELSNWLQEYMSTGAEGVVLWHELTVVLESMEERLVQKLATPQDVCKTVQEKLDQYRADGIGMADYALIFSARGLPRKVLGFQRELCVGHHCSVPVSENYTRDHGAPPKSLSPTGQIDTAPQDFGVYGIGHIEQQLEGVFLGKFAYSNDGDPIQTFALKDSEKDFYPAVELRILTNWGNPAYTCVYRFRVHGQPKTV